MFTKRTGGWGCFRRVFEAVGGYGVTLGSAKRASCCSGAVR